MLGHTYRLGVSSWQRGLIANGDTQTPPAWVARQSRNISSVFGALSGRSSRGSLRSETRPVRAELDRIRFPKENASSPNPEEAC